MSFTFNTTCMFFLLLCGAPVISKGRYYKQYSAHYTKRTCPGKSHLVLSVNHYEVIDLDQQIEQYHAHDSKACQSLCVYDATCESATWVPEYYRCFLKNARTHNCPSKHSKQRFAPFSVKQAYVWTRICDCLPIRSIGGKRHRKHKYGVANFKVTLDSEIGYYKCRKTRSHGFHCNRELNHYNPHYKPHHPAPSYYPSQPNYPPQSYEPFDFVYPIHSEYSYSKPEHVPSEPGYPPSEPDYPPSELEYPPSEVEYPPSELEYPPSELEYPPSNTGHQFSLVSPSYPREPQYPPSKIMPPSSQPKYETMSLGISYGPKNSRPRIQKEQYKIVDSKSHYKKPRRRRKFASFLR